MADHPLRPATRLRLGRPLPYQLADGTRTHPRVQPFMKRAAFPTDHRRPTYAVLAILSDCYPPLKGRSSTCYSPVRHFTHGRSRFLVRLACVRPAANVRSEPGSNSPVNRRADRSAHFYNYYAYFLKLALYSLFSFQRPTCAAFCFEADDSTYFRLAVNSFSSDVFEDFEVDRVAFSVETSDGGGLPPPPRVDSVTVSRRGGDI